MNNSQEYNAILNILKDNDHCPAHRNCDKCGYNHGKTGCKLMQMTDKLVKAGVVIGDKH